MTPGFSDRQVISDLVRQVSVKWLGWKLGLWRISGREGGSMANGDSVFGKYVKEINVLAGESGKVRKKFFGLEETRVSHG